MGKDMVRGVSPCQYYQILVLGSPPHFWQFSKLHRKEHSDEQQEPR